MFYVTACTCTTGYAIPVQKDSKAKATLDRLMWRPVGSNKGIQKGCQSGKADNLDTVKRGNIKTWGNFERPGQHWSKMAAPRGKKSCLF